MDRKEKIESKPLETVEPIGNRVLIRKDEDKKETKGGIQLPDNIEIPTITGRIVAISAEVENAPDLPLRQYDKVLFNPKGAVPVEFEDNRLRDLNVLADMKIYANILVLLMLFSAVVVIFKK